MQTHKHICDYHRVLKEDKGLPDPHRNKQITTGLISFQLAASSDFQLIRDNEV
jgi:hypothetical protein